MKKRMIERLDLLAEITEAKWLQEIVRHTKTLDHVAKQRRLLAAYREKLRDSWRSGSVLEAGGGKARGGFRWRVGQGGTADRAHRTPGDAATPTRAPEFRASAGTPSRARDSEAGRQRH